VEPKISIIMSCFNAEKFVSEAIESILLQTYTNFEFIIIDDGSTDNTLEIINCYASVDDRIVVIKKNNTGLVDSLNLGLKKAKGEWIARLDADDISMPKRLEKQLNYARSHKLSLVGSGCHVITESGYEIRKYSYPVYHNQFIKHIEKNGSPFPHSSAFFRKTDALKCGGYRSRLEGAEDCDLWLRMSLKGGIGSLGDQLIKLRKHGISITGSSDIKQRKNLLIISYAARVCHILRKNGFPDPSYSTEAEWKIFLDWLEECLDAEDVYNLDSRPLITRRGLGHP